MAYSKPINQAQVDTYSVTQLVLNLWILCPYRLSVRGLAVCVPIGEPAEQTLSIFITGCADFDPIGQQAAQTASLSVSRLCRMFLYTGGKQSTKQTVSL